MTSDDKLIRDLVARSQDAQLDAAPADLPSTGATTYVLTRADDDWRIALAQTTPIR